MNQNQIIGWMDINSIDDIQQFIVNNPDHWLSLPWEQMLDDMRIYGEEYTVQDFIEEGWMQINRGNQ